MERYLKRTAVWYINPRSDVAHIQRAFQTECYVDDTTREVIGTHHFLSP